MSRSFTTGQKVQFDNPNIGVSSPLTVSCWVRPGTLDTSNGNAILSYGQQSARGFLLSSTAATKPEIRSADGSVYALNHGTSLVNGTWSHVVVTFETNGATVNLRIYLDGVAAGPNIGCGHTAPNSTDDIIIGAPWAGDSTGRSNWNGQIADVYFWNAFLSTDEIAAIRLGQGRRIRPANLTFYAPLWGAHSPEPNLAGSSVTGTVTSATRGDDPPVRLFTPSDGTYEEIAAAPAGGQPSFVRAAQIQWMRSGGRVGIFR